MTERVKAWMTGDPVSVEATCSALEAFERMLDRGIRHLPVLDEGRRVVGVLSIDDLQAALPSRLSNRVLPSAGDRRALGEWRVAELMTHAPETTREDTSLAEATERMLEGRIGCLPVVDSAEHLVAILSESDLLRALATSLWSDSLREERASSPLEEIVQGLQRERTRLLGRLERDQSSARELSIDAHETPTDDAERGSDLQAVRELASLDSLVVQRLGAIEQALVRAAEGRLDRCERCGGDIPVPRLRAMPGATTCIQCAREGGS